MLPHAPRLYYIIKRSFTNIMNVSRLLFLPASLFIPISFIYLKIKRNNTYTSLKRKKAHEKKNKNNNKVTVTVNELEHTPRPFVQLKRGS